MPDFQFDGNNNFLWPWDTYKRIENTLEESVWHYNRIQVRKRNRDNSQMPFNIGQQVHQKRFGIGKVSAYQEGKIFCAWLRFENGEIKLIDLTVGKVEVILVS